MTNERFFRMLSVAVLGLLALAVVPHSEATDAPVPTAMTQEAVEAVAPVEVVAVQEINEINAGHFDPIQAALNGTDADMKPIIIASPVKTTSVSAMDPNLQ